MGDIATPKSGHAIVFGASGVNGWAFVNALATGYPDPKAFDHITAFTNRPLDPEKSQWPITDKPYLVSGLDLVYFCAYVMDTQPEKEIELNIGMLNKTVLALEKLCPNFRVVVLPTGVKAYGVHLLDKFPFKDNLPLKETHPEISEPYRSQLFYTHQYNLLRELCKGKNWTYCDVRPDIIIGFVPNNTLYNLAQWIALYLSLYRRIHGEGAEVVFPGTKSWTIQSNDSSQDIIARFAIHASLHPEMSAGQSFNIADNVQPTSWSVKWPIICHYFGLKGVAPINGPGPDPAAFLHEHQDEWLAMEKECNLQTGHVLGNNISIPYAPHFLVSSFDFDRPLDLTKAHQTWGDAKEERDVQGAWYTAFDRFRKARIIP
ncbi:hypothetical protein ABOM_000564 [Aspergillus bombycis]|uniref:PRISE-like Rossmann-fold domain-containing protein n=1 Tax=Aspergillus bombycis TaxID=109264 RepID=A0A1F8AFQ4_9EURO|nr:hypothetical protein ABOM_000564 [Aspergillus bombycis]OGM50573.1 hypothetical protein ABOM_000564 [Aspergillus bombycis]